MLCNQQSWGRQSLFNHSNKDKCVSVFCRLSQNTILKWAVSKLLLLFKIYTSYIMSKCKSVKMINIPWFLVPHFYLLSVESYKRLKLKPMEDKFLSSGSILSRTSLCSYFVSWKIYLFTSKKITLMSSTEMIIPFYIIVLRLWP